MKIQGPPVPPPPTSSAPAEMSKPAPRTPVQSPEGRFDSFQKLPHAPGRESAFALPRTGWNPKNLNEALKGLDRGFKSLAGRLKFINWGQLAKPKPGIKPPPTMVKYGLPITPGLPIKPFDPPVMVKYGMPINPGLPPPKFDPPIMVKYGMPINPGRLPPKIDPPMVALYGVALPPGGGITKPPVWTEPPMVALYGVALPPSGGTVKPPVLRDPPMVALYGVSTTNLLDTAKKPQ